MKRTLTVMTMVIALAMSTMAGALADGHAEITSPTAGEVIYEDTLDLEAMSGVNVDVNVAVRATEGDNDCHWKNADGTTPQLVYRNVDGGLSTNGDGIYSESISLMDVEPGLYCFAFDPADAERISVDFYIVDEYAKVGGVIDLSDDGPSKGNGTHAMEGVVGNAGTYGTVGSITVNYRELDKYVTYDATSITLFAPTGIGVEEEVAAYINTEDGGRFYVLDRDADGTLDAPRGAIQFFPEFPVPSVDAESEYAINATPPNTGADSWVPMLKGNNHVGIR